MIHTYSEYIARYIARSGLSGVRTPGEHHFVGVYLVPKLFRLNRLVPDYVNPDGTKRLLGDVIYFKDGSHRCGIEVKLGTIRLTKNEFNNWIVGTDRRCWPNVFLGVGSAGLMLLPWTEFRRRYVASINNARRALQKIDSGYGPMKSVNALLPPRLEKGCFPVSSNPREALALEVKFLGALARLVDC